jgi:hypothetical protein
MTSRAELITQARMLDICAAQEESTLSDAQRSTLRDHAAALRAQAEAVPEAGVVAWEVHQGSHTYLMPHAEFIGRSFDAAECKALYTAPPADDRARELLKALDYLTDPEDRFDSAINPGPERDELQRAYDAYKGIKR